MSTTKTEFLNFANNNPTSPEFDYRNRISRAYYAAYHSANEHYEDDRDIYTDGDHSELIRTLKESRSRTKSYIGYKLASLKSQRVIADYKLDANVYETDLKSALEETEKIIQELENN